MNKRQIPILFLRYVAPLLVLGCAGWFVYSMGAQDRPKRKKAPVRKSIPVELIQARPHSGTLDVIVSGVAIPFRDVQIAARVSGEVVYKSDSLSPGHVVDEGELLIRVDPSDYEIEVARLKQEVAKAKLDIERLQLEKENTQRVLTINQDILSLRKRGLRRLDRLRNTNAASDSEADVVEMALLSAVQQTTSQENEMRTFDSQSKTLQTTLELANLQLRRAMLDLERTEIKAPFTGVVIAKHVEQNGMLAAGAIVATIEDTSKVEVRASLRDEDIAFLQGGSYELPQTPVTVEYERGGEIHAWHGVLSRQDGLGIDEKTRTMPVRICVDNPTQSFEVHDRIYRRQTVDGKPNPSSGERRYEWQPLTLLRGMFVRVRLHCEPPQPLLVVPESVIRPGKTIWVMRGNELQIEPVRIARIEDGVAYLNPHNSPLNMNEKIISSPVPNVKPGLSVSMIKPPKRPRSDARQSVGNVDDPPSGERSYENLADHGISAP